MDSKYFVMKQQNRRQKQIARILNANADNETISKAMMSPNKEVYTNNARSANAAVTVAVKAREDDEPNHTSSYYLFF